MNTMKTPSFISVSQLNFYVKSLLDGDMNLRYVFVTGEISNLTNHNASGHIYLSLKDEKATVKAVMFAGSARNLRFQPQNGMKVIVRGRVTVYEPSGQYQLYIEDMQPDGIGSLTIAYEQLKSKLEAEGLFDKKYKKPIPKFPKVICVITSITGAALQDIRNILSRRWPYSEVEIKPVMVQGDSAPAMLTRAIAEADAENTADVIIIGRGGGSMEDLWAFNSEDLARAIFKCRIPVISAVGHETDFTICDFVSDMRAPTPSAAAELATPDRFAEIDLLLKQKQYLFALSESFLSKYEAQLSDCAESLEKLNPTVQYDENLKAFSLAESRLKAVGDKLISDREIALRELKHRLFAINPSEVLRRGYSVTSKGGKTIYSVKELKEGDSVKLTFSDGSLNARIES
ncbi:MAG: exodeoxyribonuclease VII large subunit [Ruminococcus sp.]